MITLFTNPTNIIEIRRQPKKTIRFINLVKDQTLKFKLLREFKEIMMYK